VLALLSELPTSIISEIVQRQTPRLYIDFIQKLPAEICLKILSNLDPDSLVNVIRTCRPWCDLALDTKLWENLYYREGWKAITSEIRTSESNVNIGLNDSIGHLHRIQNAEGHTSKIRALLNEDDDNDTFMSDSDRTLDRSDSNGSRSLFGSPTSSFSNSRFGITSAGDVEMETSAHGMRGLSHEQRPRRRDPHMATERSLPPILPPQDPRALRRSTLWMWDGARSRYRINWKYLYDMRRRLESNWELGRFTNFQFPHPLHPDEGHTECIYSIQFDSNYLVSGSRDQTMRIWNTHTRRLIRPPLVGHGGSVLCLQFDASPEEDIIVSGSSDSNIIIWRFSTGDIIQKLDTVHSESVLNVRFDKRILVTSSKDKTIKIFNRRPLRYGDVGYSTRGTVDPVGFDIKRYGMDPDLAHELPVKPPFTMIAKLEGHNAAVNAIQVVDNKIVSVSGDRQIKIWNWPQQLCTRTIPAHDKGIACVEYDGRRIVSGSSDNKVCIFDAATGAGLCQLVGHTKLVRTVQAGFGDFPYSEVEDEKEARRADAAYFKAVEDGTIDTGEIAARRNRRGNAGSSRPHDIQSYGAKLPPSGGGGRVYGRIVSGSYDQSIIIWRRDKVGEWKPAHTLRHDEAAASAQRQVSTLPGNNPISLNELGQVPGYAPVRPLVPPIAPSAAGYRVAGINQTATLPLPKVHDAQPYLASSVYTALIEQVVPAGPRALERALANYPGMLSYETYLQAIIDREQSEAVRVQLRRVVSEAVFSAQNVQWVSNRIGAPGDQSVLNHYQASASVVAEASSSGASSSPNTSRAPQPSPMDTPQPHPAQTAVPTPALPAQRLASQQQTQQDEAHPHIPAQEGGQAALGIDHPPPAPTPAPAPAPVPHNIFSPEKRIFKLQFDARKIICCSSAPVIVGWDFCNGDPELEEASRFFASVE
jgi:F-box and WD-40 domain protein 1/11